MKSNQSVEHSDHLSPEERDKTHLPVAAVVPGLIYILFVDIISVLDLGHVFEPYFNSWSLIFAVLPWVVLLGLRKPASFYGYKMERGLAIFGWGMVAGAVWRGLSMGFLYLVQSDWTQVGWNALWLFGMLIWIPFVEETFFRAYLQSALVWKYGRWPGILIQAILFSFHPAHWSQGWIKVISIFSYGLLSGWLYDRFKSIWAPWGAHAFANVLPNILRGLVV